MKPLVFEVLRQGQGVEHGSKSCKRVEDNLEQLVTWKFVWRNYHPLELTAGRMESGPAKDAGNEDILGDLLEIGGYAPAQLGRETVSAAAVERAEAQGGCQK